MYFSRKNGENEYEAFSLALKLVGSLLIIYSFLDIYHKTEIRFFMKIIYFT